MTTLLAAVLLSRPQVTEIVLQRGREVTPLTGEAPYKYWGCEDATLDGADADVSRGGDSNLVSGPSKMILIQFRDLNIALGPTANVKSASLVLGLIQGQPKLNYARWIKKPWTEGPLKTLTGMLRGGEDPAGAASWRSRRIGSIPWQFVGALGDGDSEKLDGLSLVKVDDITYRVDGLGPIIQRQLQRPAEIHGLLLNFQTEVDFLSSNASIDRPKLVVSAQKGDATRGADLSVTMIDRTPEYPVAGAKTNPEPSEPLTYTAHVKNVGTADCAAFDAQWFVDDVAKDILSVSEPVPVGHEKTVTLVLPYRANLTDHRSHTVALRIFPKGVDVCRGNNLLEVAANGKSLEVILSPEARARFDAQINHLGSFGVEDWLQSQLGQINETLFRYSRFAFAPNGVVERLRLQRIAETTNGSCDVSIDLSTVAAPTIGMDRALTVQTLKALGLVAFPKTTERFPGILGYGDTRAEVNLVPTATMAEEPSYDPLSSQELLEPTGLLCATDVGALNSNLLFRGGPSDYLFDVPQAVLRVQDNSGKPLLDATITITQVNSSIESAPIFQGKVTAEPLILPNQPADPVENLITGRKLGPNPFGKIELSGTNGELKVKVDRYGVSRTFSLTLWQLLAARYRAGGAVFVTRPLNMPQQPINMANLVTSFNPQKLPEPKGGFLLIDLGKTHTIGLIKLEGNLHPGFEIAICSSASDLGKPFFRELDFDWRKANQGAEFYGAPLKGRFIRIINRLGLRNLGVDRIEAYAVAGG